MQVQLRPLCTTRSNKPGRMTAKLAAKSREDVVGSERDNAHVDVCCGYTWFGRSLCTGSEFKNKSSETTSRYICIFKKSQKCLLLSAERANFG